MLSPSDYNSAVPQFTNGEYASNPINPLYIEEPDATNYNRGVEPLQTLPAQWWNWLGKQFTLRFNKLNIYVKNIFNELAQLLSLVNMTPDGTEQSPTVGQLKTMFQTEYPKYMALLMYPIGSLYWTGKAPDDGGDPNEIFGGTWVQIKGMFVFAKGDSDTLNATGGTKTETLTINQIPSHTHTFTGTAVTSGGSSATNTGNTQPTFTGTAVTSGANNRGHTHQVSASGFATGGAYDFTGIQSTVEYTSLVGTVTKAFASSASCSGICTQESGSEKYSMTGGAGSWGNLRINASHDHYFTPKGEISIRQNPSWSFSTSSGAESQNHTHSVTASGTIDNVGGGQAHNNMPPYIVKYCWERTA